MNKLKISVLTALLVSGLNGYEIDKNQEVTGFAKIHGETQRVSNKADDSKSEAGFSMGSVGLGYSYKLDNLKLNAEGIANFKISEKNDDDYDDKANKFGVRQLNIGYSTDAFEIMIGREEIDLEWIGDYYDALFTKAKLNDITIQAGVSRGKIVLDDDDSLGDYERIKDKDDKNSFLYFIDASYEKDVLTLNPYLFGVKDLFTGYGIKAEGKLNNFSLMAHYAGSSEKNEEIKDGSIYNIEAGFESVVNLKVGYIKASKDGIGSLDKYGDNINPLEEGNQVYEADAKTLYLGVEKEIDKLALGAMYGHSKTDSLTEKEINFNAVYAINDNIEFEFIYSHTDNDDEKTNNFKGNLSYSF